MKRYGRIEDSKCTAQELRIQSFKSGMRGIDFGNCGVPQDIQYVFNSHVDWVEDVFIGIDSIYILPSSREAAENLYDVVVRIEDGEEYALADDVSWYKLGDRYWLGLWFD